MLYDGGCVEMFAIKVGFKGVYISGTCFPDVRTSVNRSGVFVRCRGFLFFFCYMNLI